MHKAKNPIQWPAPMVLHMTEKDRAQPSLPPTMPEHTNIYFSVNMNIARWESITHRMLEAKPNFSSQKMRDELIKWDYGETS